MIDLCVVNYNVKDKLKRLLDNLNSDDDGSSWNLYIADNGSTDESSDFIADNYTDYRIEQFHQNDNIGYAAAINDLAAEGTSEIIGILNSDVWLTSQDVAAIKKSFDENKEIGILGPKQRDESGNITHAGIFGTHTRPMHRGWKEPDPLDTKYRTLDEAITVSGSAYFIRRSIWDEMTSNPEYNLMLTKFRNSGLITDRPSDGQWRGSHQGAFLPTRHYYEETFCSYFAHYLGHKVFYDGRISIGHSWHASSDVGGKADSLFTESRSIFRNACDYLGIEHD